MLFLLRRRRLVASSSSALLPLAAAPSLSAPLALLLLLFALAPPPTTSLPLQVTSIFSSSLFLCANVSVFAVFASVWLCECLFSHFGLDVSGLSWFFVGLRRIEIGTVSVIQFDVEVLQCEICGFRFPHDSTSFPAFSGFLMCGYVVYAHVFISVVIGLSCVFKHLYWMSFSVLVAVFLSACFHLQDVVRFCNVWFSRALWAGYLV